MNQPRPTSESQSGSDPDSKVDPSVPTGSKPRPRSRLLMTTCVAGLAVGVVWYMVGRDLVTQYSGWREESRAAEDNAPIGYLGLNLRRSYNDRAVVFLAKKDGRTTLFAAKNGGGEPDDVYDVTEASIDLSASKAASVATRYRASTTRSSKRPKATGEKTSRARQEVFGLELDSGARVYPRDLLEKIEMVNDRDGDVSFLILYDRGRAKVFAFDREVDGAPVSFGSTGYSRFKQPVLYDRKTRSVWAPRE